MSKFHINKNGVPAPCKAKGGNCPLGGNETHFETQEEAQVYADTVNEGKHGLLPGVEGEKRSSYLGENWDDSISEQVKDAVGREVRIANDDEVFTGRLVDVDESGDSPKLTFDVGGGVERVVDINEVQGFADTEVSHHEFIDNIEDGDDEIYAGVDESVLLNSSQYSRNWHDVKEELEIYKDEDVTLQVSYRDETFKGKITDIKTDGRTPRITFENEQGFTRSVSVNNVDVMATEQVSEDEFKELVNEQRANKI